MFDSIKTVTVINRQQGMRKNFQVFLDTWMLELELESQVGFKRVSIQENHSKKEKKKIPE